MKPRDLTPSSPGRAALLAVVAVLGAACATAPKPVEDVRWPLPPEEPRIRFVRAFRGDDDLKTSAFSRTLRALFAAPGAALIDQPTGLALSPDERLLYVVSPTMTPIIAVDLVDSKVRVFGEAREGRPASPYAVAVDRDGNVYVSDSSANAVRVYSPDGRQVRRIEEKLQRPTGLAIDRTRGLVYVVSGATRESQQHRVEVYTLEGKHQRTIGTRGTGGGEFNFPTHLAVGADGTLYVVDMLNFRVQLFSADGALQGMFGAPGNGPGLFDKAKAVALDSFGNIYVSDSQLALVQIFNSRYQVLMAFGGKLEKPGYMLLPGGLAISSKNTIYVADYAGRCVSEYQLVNTTAADSFRAAGERTPPPPSAPSSP